MCRAFLPFPLAVKPRPGRTTLNFLPGLGKEILSPRTSTANRGAMNTHRELLEPALGHGCHPSIFKPPLDFQK